MLIHSEDIAFRKVQFSAILLLKIAQNGGKFKFQNSISFEWIGIFQKLFGNSQTK